ncbi:MAG: thioredoxin domain-containing protein [bacterium]
MQNQTPLTVPVAIVVAGIIIAGGIIASRYVSPTVNTPTTQATTKTVTLPAVSATDHIIGKTDADIVLVEYSDTECPFCKVFHGTMHTLISEYGPKNQLAWVYRHLPLYKPDAQGRSLHSKAGKESEATECAYDQGGNDAFWKYIDLVYQTTTSNNTLDSAKLPVIAKQAGLNVANFNTCLSSGKYSAAIAKSYDEGFVAGAQGTPYNILILKKPLSEKARQQVLNDVIKTVAKTSPGSTIPADLIGFSDDGAKITFSGALPVEMMKVVIEAIVK